MLTHNPYKKYSRRPDRKDLKDRKDSEPSKASKASQNTGSLRVDDQSAKHSPPKHSQPSQHIKISIRLKRGIVTSLTLKKSIIAIWLLYTADTDVLPLEQLEELMAVAGGTTRATTIAAAGTLEAQKELENLENLKNLNAFKEKANELVNDFVYECLEDWDKDTGKGLSEFVTEIMIADFLEDYDQYELILNSI
jgi:hypothetical protein